MLALVFAVLFATAFEIGMAMLLNKYKQAFHMKLQIYIPAVCIGNGLLAALSYLKYSMYEDNVAPAYWFFCILTYLFCMMLFDLKHKLLPNWLHLIPISAYIFCTLEKTNPVPIEQSVITVVVAAVVMGFIILVQRDALGIGDVKMLLICGAYIGFYCLGVIFRGCVVAFILCIVMLLMKKASKKSELPFAPFMFFGALLL